MNRARLIANARMYSVTAQAGTHWHALLSSVIAAAGLPVDLFDYPAPAPLDELWHRDDQGAVFMCGLPFARARPRPFLVAAPVPAPPQFAGKAEYWSEFVVHRDSPHRGVSDTFGGRLALTVPGSQSGCVAAMTYLMETAPAGALFAEIISPTVTPLGALSAVADGAADIAPIDAYAYELIRLYRPDLAAQVRSVARTTSTPIPPLVASGSGFEPLTHAFLSAHTSAQELLDPLLLQRFVRPDAARYAILEQRYLATLDFWRTRPLARAIHPAFVLE